MNCATHSDLAAVAFCRTCGKPLCQNCTRDVRGVIYCESCLAARMEGSTPASPFVPPEPAGYPPLGSSAAAPRPAASSGPNPTVAGILGVIPFGIGAIYNGQYAKGLAHMFIFMALIYGADHAGNWDWFFGVAIPFFILYQIMDAVRTAKALQMGEAPPDPFGLAQTFSPGERLEGTKVPVGAAVLIGLGVLFLLHTAGIFEFGFDRFWPVLLIFLGIWLFARQWGLLGGTCAACHCERCRTRKLIGPALLLTVGVLFLLDNITSVSFGRTWPAILLVIGVVKLVQSNASWAGHVGPLPPAAPPSAPLPPVPPEPQPPASGEVKNV